jgi:hypothetical protein
MARYEVVLGPAARQAVLSLGVQKDQEDLADALGQELLDGPNADKEYRFDLDGTLYTATPLSSGGYTAVHRPMRAEELARLRRELRHPVSRLGFHVLDILSPAAGATRRMPAGPPVSRRRYLR